MSDKSERKPNQKWVEVIKEAMRTCGVDEDTATLEVDKDGYGQLTDHVYKDGNNGDDH